MSASSNPYFSLIRVVWKNGKPWRLAIVGYYIAYVLAQICMSLSPYAFGRTIDALQNFKPGHLHEVILWLIFGVMLTPLFWLFHGPARVLERNVALKIQQSFLLDVYRKLTLLPLKWHQDHHSGNIITRLNRASSSLKRFAEDQFIYIETIVRFIISISFLCWISLPVGVLSFIACLLAASTVILFDKKLIPLYKAQNEVDSHVGAGLFDYISNITTVLTLRFAELTRHNLFKRLACIWPFFKKEAVLNEVKWFTMGMLLSFVQSAILIAYVVFYLKSANAILIGTVVMIFRYQWDLSDVFFNLSAHYSELVRMNTEVANINPILQDIKNISHAIPGEVMAKAWKKIAIDDLQFSHSSGRGKNSIHVTNFSIHRGEKIALIGSSGAGKSTLLNLLSGLYEPQHARLVIDDVEFNLLEPLHAMATLIPQEPEIFENTLAFNITMDIEADADVIQEVINLSCFSSVLDALPLGLKTDIREKGLNLSVGQKQRLALSRGLFAARFSSLILMDEPTSSVDLTVEKEILSGVLTHYREATMIVSLHRLHLLPQFDRVVFLHQGEVIADGKTSDLLTNSGPVKEIWENYQSQK